MAGNFKKKLIIIFSFLLLFLIAGFMILKRSQDNSRLLSVQNSYLLNITSYKAGIIENYLAEKKKVLEKIEDKQEIKDLWQEYSQTGQITGSVFKNALREMSEGGTPMAMFSKKGIIIISTNSQPGVDYSSNEIFSHLSKEDTFELYYDQFYKQNALAGTHTVFNGNTIIGLSAVILDLKILDALAMSPREYASDDNLETYLVDQNSILLTPSKFMGRALGGGVLVQEVRSPITEMCQEQFKNQNAGFLDKIYHYTNYMGDSVVGTFTVIPSSKWCLISEYNEK